MELMRVCFILLVVQVMWECIEMFSKEEFHKDASMCVVVIMSHGLHSKCRLASCCCCCLPDPFRVLGAWGNTVVPQKPGNSPGSGPEVVKRQSRQRVSGAKSS